MDSFQSKGQTKDKIDYSKIFWKPKVGKHQVRIIPSKFNKSTPFREVYFHYGYTKGPILALTNWGEADPILEAAQKLRKSDNTDHWQMAKKITPKMRVFAPVIVRGEEASGVRLWEFGKEIYEAFLQMAADEEVGDFTDIMMGRDIKLVTVGPDSTGTAYNKTTITPSMKTSPLTEDEKSLELWLEDQVNPKESYKMLPFDEIKTALAEWLNPEEEEEFTPADGKLTVEEKPQSNYSLTTKPESKKSKADNFDALFEEDDDMPF